MSLLDRVNRNLAPPPPQQPSNGVGQQTAVATPPAPAPAPAFPPRPPAPAEKSPAPPAAAPTSGAGAPPRPGSPLLARTGLQRATGAKGSAMHAQYVELRSRVHQRLIEELVDATDNTNETVVAKLAELVGEVAA